jgi:hypothetical protein
MRLFLFLILVLIQARANALDVQTTRAFEHPSLFELAEFQDTLQQEGYWSVDARNTGAADVIGVDQIFSDSNLDETIFLKLGLRQFAPKSFNKLSGGIAYQGVARNETPYVLFFDHISMSRAKEIVSHLANPDGKASASEVALRLLIPQARAAAPCRQNPLLRQASSTLRDLDGILGFRALATCAITAAKSAAHTVASPFEALKSMVHDPSKFWNDTMEEWQRLKGFVMNVRSELSSFFSSLRNLDSEVAATIACTMIGQVAVGVGIGLLTAGAAASVTARTGAAIAALIAKLNRMRGAIEALSRGKQVGRLRSVEKLTHQVMSCATH